MPALPALLLSLLFLSFLLATMPPRSLSQAPVLSSVRMGKCSVDLHPQLRLDRTSFSSLLVGRSHKSRARSCKLTRLRRRDGGLRGPLCGCCRVLFGAAVLGSFSH